MFNVFKKQKPQDNFDFIAINIVAIYEVLQKNYKECFSKKDDLLTTSGIIDCLVYINEGSIFVDDLQQAIIVAKQGVCHVAFTSIPHEDEVQTMLMESKNLFLNFIMQIEAMIFYADNKSFGGKEIIRAVINKKKDIEEMINITKNKIENGEFKQIYQNAEQITRTFMTTDEFKEIKEKLEFIKFS